METELPLDKMTTLEKLRTLERIWEDLLRAPEEIPSPSWHEDVLKAREERVREETVRFEDWTEAKKKIRDPEKNQMKPYHNNLSFLSAYDIL
jgi:hypothetical protein